MTTDDNDIARMRELNDTLSSAAESYYDKDVELMSNFEYDALYDELVSLEASTGIVLDGSITHRVGSDVDGTNGAGLRKVRHASPMLSLSKTKSRGQMSSWLGHHVGCLSYKLDGSTVVVTYEHGAYVQAVTRGNGIIGEDITEQARLFSGIPTSVPFDGRLVVRGEALMTYSEFERVNSSQPGVAKFKNPRNLASGTMRSTDLGLLRERTIEFHPFTLVSADGHDDNSYSSRLDWLASIGFSPVEHIRVKPDELDREMDRLSRSVETSDVPTDGLVLFFDDVAYGDTLGTTGHAPRNGIAFKWADETARTTIRSIAWQVSRTGRVNPVAVFDPVELEGTTVERATLNNLSFVSDMSIGIGDEVDVYKANKIIPCVVENHTRSLTDIGDVLPDACPSCGGRLSVHNDHGSEFLMCDNDECPARQVDAIAHFVSRDAMNVLGLSHETLRKLIDDGIVSSFSDVMDLPGRGSEVVGVIDGFGERSFDKLSRQIDVARHTSAARFLYSLGIREIGKTASRDICAAYGNDVSSIVDDAVAGRRDGFVAVDGVGDVMADELMRYMSRNQTMVRGLLSKVDITDIGRVDVATSNGFVSGRTFVITGATHLFANRDGFKEYVAANGGKVSGSVSRNTDFLVTNTPDSGTTKNERARALGIEIITEDEFCERSGHTG